MIVMFDQQALKAHEKERQQVAQAVSLAARLAALRKWERRAAAADRRARLARAAIR